MPALHNSLGMPHAHLNLRSLEKRANWAGQNAGIILVFCIVGIIAIGVISLFVYRKVTARKAARAT
ncbi:MAG: hypothetical protein M1833_006379 [Piccolia ochrophora]|nr:MAG: hypothetical protein M1833_006379 [Piccolia ochrophora]